MVVLFIARLVLGPLCYAPGLPGVCSRRSWPWAHGGHHRRHRFRILSSVLSMPLPGYAAIGMGALFVAVVRAPLTGIALVVEMTEPRASSCRCSSRARRSRRAGDARLPADLRHAAGARRGPATAIGERLTRRRRLRANCCLPDIAPVH
jgi:hypothetical protein